MNEHNGSTQGIAVAPAADDNADCQDSQLLKLAEKLQRRGLKAQLVSYATDGLKSDHYDAITVTDPASPERGSMQIEKEGWVTWEYSGSLADDAGISNLADEATNALRATGIPYQPEAVAMTDENEPAGLRGTHQQQLVFLNTHWGSKYTFAAPETPGGRWTATAKFGQHDQIQQIGAVRNAVQHAAACAAQEAREARALAAFAAARDQRGVSAGVSATQPCPNCGCEITVLATLIPRAAALVTDKESLSGREVSSHV